MAQAGATKQDTPAATVQVIFGYDKTHHHDYEPR